MRSIALIALACAACTAPAQTILPGILDLAVAEGGQLKLCPEDGVKDTTATADCVLGPPAEAMAPYAVALKAKGWREEKGGAIWWPPAGGSPQSCLVVSAFQSNYSLSDRTLLEFRLIDPARDPMAACLPAT